MMLKEPMYLYNKCTNVWNRQESEAYPLVMPKVISKRRYTKSELIHPPSGFVEMLQPRKRGTNRIREMESSNTFGWDVNMMAEMEGR